jgi:hypothetical protein
MSPKDQVAANQLPSSAIPSALPSAPQKTTIPQQYDGSQDVMVDFNEKMAVSDGQPDVPQSVEPSAEAPPRQPETAQPAPQPAAPPVPAGAIRPPGDNATYGERLDYANAELAKDVRDPVRAEQEAAERREIMAIAKARNLDNFKRGVGHGTQNPNGVTDEQREAYWRGRAAKGDKYAIGQVQAIDARRAESLRRQELDTPVKVETVRQEGQANTEGVRGKFMVEGKEIDARSALEKAHLDSKTALEAAKQDGDTKKAIAALDNQTKLIVGLATAVSKDSAVSDADKMTLDAYATTLKSLNEEIRALRKPSDIADPKEIDDYNKKIEALSGKLETARGNLDKFLNGLSSRPKRGGDNPAPDGNAKPAGGGDDYAEGTTATLKDGRTVRKVGNKWVVEKQESVSK